MLRTASPLLPVTLLLICLCLNPALAQWSSDPSVNLNLADRSSEQVQPKLIATSDGGFYVSWFDNSGGGYDVYLQRLDAAGNEQWTHNGVLVADRDFTSTQDYGLDVDTSDNGLLAFRLNDGNGTAQIVAQKFSPKGLPLWTPPGKILSVDSSGANSPRVTGTSGGGAAIMWSGSGGAIRVQKLNANGEPLWGILGVTITPPSGFFFPAGLHSDNDGNVIVSWSAQLSFNNRQMWTQKLASINGGNLWGTDPVKIFDGVGGAMQLGYFPDFVSDDNGGAVFAWYTVTTTGSVRVQHINAAGTMLFPQNGLMPSTNTSVAHYEPAGAFDATTGDIYVLWRQTDIATQSQIAVYAQRIDSSGTRQWGTDGKEIVTASSTNQTQLRALPLVDGFIASWVSGESPARMPIHVARINADSEYGFSIPIIDIKTAATSTSRIQAALSTDGFAAYVWTDATDSGEGDVKAQNIHLDGTLGNIVSDLIFADGFEGMD